MICTSCNSTVSRITTIKGVDYCPACAGIAESGGVKTTGLITRNSLRVRSESVMHEGDTLLPHRWDKHARKLVANEDFLALHAENASLTLTETDAIRSGLPKLSREITRQKTNQAKAKALHRAMAVPEGDASRSVSTFLTS